MLQLKILFSKFYQSFSSKQKIMVKGLKPLNNCPEQIVIQRPITWEGLEKFFSSDESNGNLRCPESQLLYEKFKVYIKENNIQMQEYIENKILGYDHNPERPIFYVRDIEVDQQNVQVYAAGHPNHFKQFYINYETFQLREGVPPDCNFLLLTNNNFPYDLQKGIHHWVIWSSTNLPDSLISRLLQDILLGDYEWKVYENTPVNKSVPEISHKQLFIRKKQVQTADE